MKAKTTSALLIGALIAVAGFGAYALFEEDNDTITIEEMGDSFDEGVEEMGDEFEDATDGQ